MSNKVAEPQMDQKGQKQQTDPIAQKNQLDRYDRKNGTVGEYNEQEWETKLFEINGFGNTLWHKSINSEDNTVEFIFEQRELKLHQGLMLQLEDKRGLVVGFKEQAAQINSAVQQEQAVQINSAVQQEQVAQANPAAQPNEKIGLIFSGSGGKLKFQDTDMPQLAEQELAVTNIVIPAVEPGQTAKAKIRASLMDTVTIEPMPGMRLELKNGKYTNTGGEEKGALHFETAVWFEKKQLADRLKMKYDDAGLQMEDGEKALLDVDQFDYAKKKKEAIQTALQTDEERKEEFAGGELQLKLVLDKDRGIHFSMDGVYQKASMIINQRKIYLKYAEGLPGHFRTAEEANAKLQENELYLQNVSIHENEVKGKKGKLTFHNNGQENLTLQDVEMKEADTLWAGSGQGTLDHKAVKLTGIQLKQDQLLQADTAEMNIEGFTTHLQKYSYQAGKTNAYESAKVETKVYAGLDRENMDNADQKGEPEFLFAFSLAAGQIQDGDFEKGTQGEENLSHHKLIQKNIGKQETTEAIQMKRKIFTKDGFAELETDTMQFQKQGGDAAKVVGKGNFKLSEIPYKLTTRTGKVVEGVANSPEDDLKEIDYSIDSKGNLFADFKEEEANMNLKKKLFKKFENVSESNIKQIKLSGLKIEDGYLKVSSLRIDIGGGIEQELEKKKENDPNSIKNLKDVFGECSLSATIANITENVKLTPKGIEIQQDDKYTLGIISVEGLFGFLSGEIDYPEGTVGVSAEKGVETPEKVGFLKIGDKGNLSEGISIPIPIPGVPGLSVKFGLKPYASVGGKVSVEASRGKSFSEPWLNGTETLKIGGNLGAEAKAGVAAFVGVAAGADQIASVDLKLNGKLEAALKGGLKLDTALEKEPGKSMQLAKNLNFNGGIEGALNAGLSISSDAKFLFWKKQLFEFKLAEKELGKLGFKGSAYKDKNEKGLLEGWHFEGMELTAEFLNSQVKMLVDTKDMKGSLIKVFKELELKKLNNLLEGEAEQVKVAWSALEQLEEKKNHMDMMYLLDKTEIKELEKQISTLTEKVKTKIQNCVNLLERQKKLLAKDAKKGFFKMQRAERQRQMAEMRKKEADYMMQLAEKGGFKKADIVGYQDWKNERYKTAIGKLGITMLLGAYESGKTKFSGSAEQMQSDPTKGEIDLKTFMEAKVLDQGLTQDSYKFLQPLSTEYDLSYFDFLNQYPDLTFRELLQYAVAGKYTNKETKKVEYLANDGNTLRELLKLCLKAFIVHRRIPKNESKEAWEEKGSQRELQYKEAKQNIETRFETVFRKSYKSLTNGWGAHKPEDIFTEQDQIVSDRKVAEEEWERETEAWKNTQMRLTEVQGRQAEYSSKLEMLKNNALGALKDKKFDSQKAQIAVEIMTEDYGKKMKDGTGILQSFSSDDPHKGLMEKAIKGGNITQEEEIKAAMEKEKALGVETLKSESKMKKSLGKLERK